MTQQIHDLSRDDWNRLFPIELVPSRLDSTEIFEQERRSILSRLGNEFIVRVEHFGSTSIPGIMAKPIVDILIEVPAARMFDQKLIDAFQALDYAYFKVPERDEHAAYMSFARGYVIEGAKQQIYHIHACESTHKMWSQLLFRDYLIRNPDRARAYESLKIDLATKYRHDRGRYVLSKTGFVDETLRLATSEMTE